MKKAILFQTLLSLLFLAVACGFLKMGEVEDGPVRDHGGLDEDYVYHLRHHVRPGQRP